MPTENESPIVISVETSYPVSAEQIANILCGEFEGNDMASWINRAYSVEPEGVVLPRTMGVIWYMDEPWIASDQFAFTVNYDDPENDQEGGYTGMKTIRREDIQKGLQIMASEYPDHWADIVNDNADAITYDVAVQCIVLGSVVYG